MHTMDDPTTTPEECLRALPARIRAMVSEAIRQGAATTLVVAQLQFGAAVKVLVVQQAFPPPLDDDDYMDDLFEHVESAANAVLAKVNAHDILHTQLDHQSMWDVLVVQVMTRFGLWDDRM